MIIQKIRMYWIVDMICFLSAIAQIVYSIAYLAWYDLFYGIIWIFVYPVILQALYNLFSCIFFENLQYKFIATSHLIYRQEYNISFYGLEKCHPFDSFKYGNVYRKLVQSKVIRDEQVHTPNKPSRYLLMEVMSKCYLLKLCYTLPVCFYLQIPLLFLPAFILRKVALDPMLYATEGTLMALRIASQMKWAINLSGGYHHASFNGGGGFCIYPDISLAVHYLKTRMSIQRIMIIDCDAHQGNGYERDCIGDEGVYIVDLYNHRIYPGDSKAKKAISKDISIGPYTTDQQYMSFLQGLNEDMDDFMPQFLIYNAGTDILIGDPLGNCKISAEGIIARDETIFKLCINRNIPIIMVFSGGYQKINAEIIALSIENIYSKFA